ncbi:MAG TPA: glycosyl hydrolase [Rugosimonospora sp.]|nr:glycosyl hydrolase [Rugosimonospora sp.]
MGRAHPATVLIAVATALVVLVEGVFSSQSRLLTSVYPQPPMLPRAGVPAAHGALGERLPTGTGRIGTAPDSNRSPACTVGAKLVPTCGVLWGVAPGAHTVGSREQALRTFEVTTGRTQAIYHAYHSGTGEMFPTAAEIGVAREPGHPRLLLISWRPDTASWAAIAKGNKQVDAFLDRLAVHLRRDFPQQFFFAIHHEPENEVNPKPGSGYTPADYRAMYRHVVTRLRAHGVRNMVTVMVFMAYPPYEIQSWWPALYPGNDVVDWVGWDTYGYSRPKYGYGDFAELMNRTTRASTSWPGIYNWAVRQFPGKPFIVAEWGIWRSPADPLHPAYVFNTAQRQIQQFPRIKALCYFDTPNSVGKDSRVEASAAALAAYRALGALPIFQVRVSPLP